MKKCLFIIWTICVWASGQPGQVWFDQVKDPSKVAPREFARLTLALHKGLKDGLAPRQLAALAPDEGEPRIVFLTIGEDIWPSRCYIGTGYSLRMALENAASFLVEREKSRVNDLLDQIKSRKKDAARTKEPVPRDWLEREAEPGAWNWLKLEIVQYVRASRGFELERTKMAMSSMAGLAFDEAAGFAFTPSQLTGRCLLSSERFLATLHIGNYLSETLNLLALKNWMELCAQNHGHAVSLFETDCYFTDGTDVVPLYRGHAYPSVPSAADCLALAQRGAEAVGACLDAAKGTVQAPFPDWFPGLDTVRGDSATGTEELDSVCELVLAFCRLATVVDDDLKPRFKAWAQLAFKPIAASAMRYGASRQCLCIVEDEEVDAESHVVPRKIAWLRTNALAVLAMDELATLAGEKDDSVFLRDMRLLATHVAGQAEPNGGFIYSRVMPRELVELDKRPDKARWLEAAALASLAINRAACRFANMEWMGLADGNIQKLAEQLKETEILDIPVSSWLAEALVSYYKRDGEHILQLMRMCAVADAAREGQPIMVDNYGMVKDWPSMTAAAGYSWTLAVAARNFAKRGEQDKAARLVRQALPYLVFQSQAQIDFPTASALARPRYYLGFFRDHLEDFGFDLNGQVTQILSLAGMHRLLKEHFQENVPGEAEAKAEIDKLRRLYDRHPQVLSEDLLMTTEGTAMTRRALEGAIGQQGERQIKRKKPLRRSPARDQISAGVVKPAAKPKKK